MVLVWLSLQLIWLICAFQSLSISLILKYLPKFSYDELFHPLAPNTLLFRQLWSTVRMWFHAPCFSNWRLCSITDDPTPCSVILQWQKFCKSFLHYNVHELCSGEKRAPVWGWSTARLCCDLTLRPISFGAHEVNWSMWGWWRDECGVSICIGWTDWLTSTKMLLAPALRTFGRSSSIIPLPASIRGNWQPLLSLHFVAVLCRNCGFAKRTWTTLTALYWLLLADSQRVTNWFNLTNIWYWIFHIAWWVYWSSEKNNLLMLWQWAHLYVQQNTDKKLAHYEKPF